MINRIPICIQELLDFLNNKGFCAYLVGGCVRDLLRGEKPKDWDICTSARPETILHLFPSCIQLGSRFGTLGVQTLGGIIEITTFRQELEYRNGRYPEVIFVQDLNLDLKRRDFTINAMAYHPKSGLVDLFKGQEDLSRKILRCVGEGDVRFQEDALRILRLMRFSCTLGFAPESETLKSAKRQKHRLALISKERIRDELILALKGEFFVDFFKMYQEIFADVLPELQCAKRHKITNLSLMFAFLFQHQEDIQALRRLKFPKTIIERTYELLKYKHQEIKPCKITLKMLLREIGYDCLMAVLELQKLSGKNTKQLYALLQEIMINNECFSLKDLQINGHILKQMGLKGQEIGEILQKLLDEVISQTLENSSQTLKQRALLLASLA